jgi:hypothetical protein
MSVTPHICGPASPNRKTSAQILGSMMEDASGEIDVRTMDAVEQCSPYALVAETGTANNSDSVHVERPGIQRRQGLLHINNFLKVPTSRNERTHVHDVHGDDSWQAKILHFVHKSSVTYFLVSLLLLDVIILFVELFLTAEFPECRIVERDSVSCCEAIAGDDDHARFLSEDGEHNFCEVGSPGAYPSACDPHKYPGVHTAHQVLRWITVLILSTFFVELFLLIVACGPRLFFSKFFYCFDFSVVTVSLGLEISFLILQETEVEFLVGLLILGRLWRFVRIGHGIFEATYELSTREQEERAEYTKELEELCRANGLVLPRVPEAEET